MAPSGLAHAKCGVQSLSITAPAGKKKLNAVTTQIQYFVVALAPGTDVSTQAAQPSSDPYSSCTLK
jgi:hypothetical protein